MNDRKGSSWGFAGDMVTFNVPLVANSRQNGPTPRRSRAINPKNGRLFSAGTLLTAFERLQGSTHARDNIVPGELFARRVFEIKTVDRLFGSVRKIATTIVDHALICGRDREEGLGHAHIVDGSARRSVVASEIGSRRFILRIRLRIDRQRSTTITGRVLLPGSSVCGSFVHCEHFTWKLQARAELWLNKRRPFLRHRRPAEASQ